MEAWGLDYSQKQPHIVSEYQTPVEFHRAEERLSHLPCTDMTRLKTTALRIASPSIALPPATQLANRRIRNGMGRVNWLVQYLPPSIRQGMSAIVKLAHGCTGRRESRHFGGSDGTRTHGR